MCPHGFQLMSTNCSLISFFPNSCSALLVSPSGPTEIEMTGLPPGAPGFHKQDSPNVFTNNHNLFRITHSSDMLPWLKPILHKYIHSMLEWKIFYIAPHLGAYQRTTEFHICVSIDSNFKRWISTEILININTLSICWDKWKWKVSHFTLKSYQLYEKY